MRDLISRQYILDAFAEYIEEYKEVDEKGNHDPKWCAMKEAEMVVKEAPSVKPEIIHCCDCIYYDPEHIEKNGVRYEYKDMPKAAFVLETGLVESKYGINVGGKCCRDYNVGYSEDKRVFVSKQNYCGRARRRQDE